MLKDTDPNLLKILSHCKCQNILLIIIHYERFAEALYCLQTLSAMFDLEF